MTRTIFATCFVLPLALNAASPSSEEMALHDARTFGALAKECLRVVDDEGYPVVGATIWGGLQIGGSLDDFIPIRGVTDTNGEFVIEGKCTDRIRCDIIKDEFYKSEFLVTDYCYTHSLNDGKWHPYGEENTICLKKIRKPVALIHKKPTSPSPPSLGEWYGYDIERRQWVRPFGDGEHSDVLVRISIFAKNTINDFRAVMEVSFTNNPYAGAYVLRKDEFSEMKSVYEADTNGLYQSSFVFIHEKHQKVQQTPSFKYVSGAQKIDTRLDGHSYMVFRTRTEVDAEGELVSAHYGKIYGPWEFFGGMRAANVQFNPTPNDPNLEDAETADYSRMQRRHFIEQTGNDNSP